MTTSEYEGLSLQEKERYWLKALEQKSTDEMLTKDQWWYEWEERVLYEDENIIFSKNYVNELKIENKKRTDLYGLDECFEVMMDVDLGEDEDIQLDGYEGKILYDWEKEEGETMSWTGPVGAIGTHLFSFDDGKTVYNVFGGGKNELTDEQLKIFRKENPIMAELYLGNKE